MRGPAVPLAGIGPALGQACRSAKGVRTREYDLCCKTGTDLQGCILKLGQCNVCSAVRLTTPKWRAKETEHLSPAHIMLEVMMPLYTDELLHAVRLWFGTLTPYWGRYRHQSLFLLRLDRWRPSVNQEGVKHNPQQAKQTRHALHYQGEPQ